MLLITGQIQIETTMMHHRTQVHMAILKKSTDIKCWRGCAEKGALVPCWQKCIWYGPCQEWYAAAAKSLQSCPTLCDPIDGSPPGFPIPGILQARTLEWVAISFSNA